MPRIALQAMGLICIALLIAVAGFVITSTGGSPKSNAPAAPGAGNGTGTSSATAADAKVAPPPTMPDLGPVKKHPVGLVIDSAGVPSMADIHGQLVTLNFRNYDPAAAIDALNQASTVQIVYNPSALPTGDEHRVDLQLTNAPWLEALLQLRTQSALRINEMSSAGLTLLNGPLETTTAGWCVSGPFAVVLENVRVTSAADRTGRGGGPPSIVRFPLGGPVASGLSMTVLVLSEPQIHVAQYATNFNFDKFVDENDRPITAEKPLFAMANLPRLPVRTLNFKLNLPPDAGRKIALLRGTAPFYVAMQSQHIETQTPNETRQESVAGMQVEILPIVGIRNNPTDWDISVRFKRGATAPEKWRAIAAALPALVPEVHGPMVTPLRQFSAGATPEGEDSLLVKYSFRGPLNNPAQRVVLDCPTELREVLVPFEFHDIPLP